MPTKSFYKGTQRYEFSYEGMQATINPGNPEQSQDERNGIIASTLTFDDEEQVRVRYYYPYIKKGDVVFDIGASFGSYTLPALAIGAYVYAFSPEHEYHLIKKNIEMNGFTSPKDYDLFPYGLYSRQGLFKTDTTEFLEKAETAEAAREYTAKTNQNKENWTGWWILVFPLDEWMTTPGYSTRIDYIKIDTEGAELEVLKGGINTIKKYKPKILLELHLFKDEDIGLKIMEFLKPLGYKWKVEQYTPAVSHMFAWV